MNANFALCQCSKRTENCQMMKILSKKINSIGMAALLVAFFSLLSRVFGVVRDAILANSFGAGDILDVYYASFRIPDLIFNLFVLGAISAGFIPIFVKLINNKDDEKNCDAWDLVSNLINILILLLFFVSILGMIFSKELTSIISPGFSYDKQVLTAELTRIMFLSPILFGLSSIFGGILQSFKRFLIYCLAPIFYNIGIIIGIIFFVPFLGIHGLAWGVVFGAFLHMIIQFPIVFKLGYRYKAIVDFKNIYLRKIAIMMIPRTMSLGISQINLVVITIIATTLPTGSLTVFNFANNLQFFPIGIFGISFAIAAFPVLSSLAWDNKKLVEKFSNVFLKIMFFIIPITVLTIALRAQIVRVILGQGKFDWEDTILTMDSLGLFAISFFAQATLPLLVRMFYVKEDTKTPFYATLVSIIFGIGFSLYLPNVEICNKGVCEKLGVKGLALSYSILSIMNFIIIWIMLRYKLGNLNESKIFKSIFKMIIASVCLLFAIQEVKSFVWQFIDMEKFFGVFIQGLSAGIVGIVVYLIVCYILKSEELLNLINKLANIKTSKGNN
ncbi:murein biosynthesis integral membrane protein MurJ [Candidatus Parcubacteria bacterium]|nr:murein biosynthesis integral membrane protein MurJ [Candidatus Parcubacteria bacterium]